MFDLPDWSQRLKNYYCVLRSCKRGGSLQRAYYRLARAEHLRLVEAGIPDDKIKAVRRLLASQACMRDYQSKSKDRLLAELVDGGKQKSIDFVF